MNSMRAAMGWVAIVVLLAGLVTARAEEKKEVDPREPQRDAAYKEFQRLDREGKYSAAVPFAKKYIELTIAIDGDGSKRHSIGLNNLANLYANMGQLSQAEPLYQRCLAIREKQLGPDHPFVANCLSNFAKLYHSMGEFTKAETLYLRSLAIREKKLGPDHPDVAAGLSDLAMLYVYTCEYAKAEPLCQRSLTIREKRLGSDHLDVSASLHVLARVYECMGLYAKAEPLFQRSNSILEKQLGPDHPLVAVRLGNLGMTYLLMGQYARAEEIFQRSLTLQEKLFGPDDLEVARCIANLATLYVEMRDFVKAEPLMQRSMTIFENKLGPDHPDVAVSVNNLAVLYRSTGQYAKAEPLFQRSLTVHEKQWGVEHPTTENSLSNLAKLFGARDDWKQALNYGSRALRARHRHISGVLPFLSESEQLAFLSSVQPTDFALSLGLYASDLPMVVPASAEWLLNSKGILAETRAERARLARKNTYTETSELAARLAAVKSQLAKAVMSAPKPGDEAARFKRIEELDTQEQELSKKLGQALGTEFRKVPWVSLEELRATLPSESTFIDIARFGEFNFKAKGTEKKYGPDHYVAWITSKTDVKIVDLGEAAPIDAGVKAVRESASNANGNSAPAMKALAAKILAPLEKHISGSSRWLLSPDGDLWLAPWAALPLSNGSMVIEKYCLSYLVSGRDLVNAGYKVETTAPVIFANPDFGPAPATVAAKEDNAPLMFTRSMDLRGDLVFKPLPGTAKEAEAIRKPITTYGKSAPQMYVGAEALEAKAKALSCPKILVLSTHGFFLPTPPVERDPITGEAKPGPRAENPLLRCGLALAGANQREKASGDNDGIFTGLEIVTTDLRGTDLVVLSACETGIGQINTGEGVAGLRQCFQLAGANSVVATLWQIPDTASSALMTDFFKNLSAGQPKADALRSAQLEMIARLKKEGLAPHPFFWAAYTVTGRWK